MFVKSASTLALLLPVLLTLGCGGGSTGHDGGSSVTLTLQGQFEKRSLTGNGLSATLSVLPARFCYAEVVDQSGAVLASGYLGSDGFATTSVPKDSRVSLVVYPQFEVPAGNTSGDFFFHGSVKQGAPLTAYTDLNAFNAIPNYSVSSATITASTSGTLVVKALNSTAKREAGAFNIADQAVSFGLTVQAMEPTLRLPNLHLFWQTFNGATGFPAVAVNGAGAILQQASTRAIFQMAVRGSAGTAADAGVDEFNDGILQQRYAALLFAPYSYPANGSAPTSIIRGDNDTTGRADRGYASESTAAFISGFCDFFSAAVRNDPALVSVSSAGVPSSFRLDSHGQFAHDPHQGEFYPDAVAVSLYGIWKTALGGTGAALGSLWDATLAKGANAYLNAPLGCYPTYLSGLAATPGINWSGVQAQLALEDIGDVTSSIYFAGNSLWLNQLKPFSVAGALHTFPAADNVYYDRDQAQSYRFTQGATGPCTVTMAPLDGQDFFLELIGYNGIYAVSYDKRASAQSRTISLSALPAGTYVLRVRVGYTTAAFPAARYNLTIN